jgi:hypothetical protein
MLSDASSRERKCEIQRARRLQNKKKTPMVACSLARCLMNKRRSKAEAFGEGIFPFPPRRCCKGRVKRDEISDREGY